MEVYYEQIKKLTSGLQIPTIDCFLLLCLEHVCNRTLEIASVGMKQSTLQ